MKIETYAALLGAPVTGPYLANFDPWTPDRPHLGVDFGCIKGTDVPAVAAGMVYEIRTWTSGPGDGSFGLHLVVKRDNGTYDVYAHLDTVLVNVGERVYEGETIALSGDSGKNGPGTYDDHLHVQNSESPFFPRDLSITHDPFSVEDEVTKEQYEALLDSVEANTKAIAELNKGLVKYDPNGPYDTIASVRALNLKVTDAQTAIGLLRAALEQHIHASETGDLGS